MDTIDIPCPTDGCDGEVHALGAPIDNGTGWAITRLDGVPAVRCSRGCRQPEELEGAVESAVRAG